MTIYLVIDYGQYEGMDVKKYPRAVDALQELNERTKLGFCPVDKIIQGTELTPDQLRNLAKKEPK
jgi:hypothetical protein